jgi:sarcosine oxidase subunit alpha
MSLAHIEIIVDGRRVGAVAGESVASALLNAGVTAFRRSVNGEPRAPLCGMGVCYECRVTIDGIEHQRSCMTVVRSGMHVQTASHSETA